MDLTLLGGSANRLLAAAIADHLGIQLTSCECEPFPDGELHVAVHDSVRGRDVYVIQPTAPPVEQRLLELLLLADACRRAGAARLTAVVPYFGYARQDRRSGSREPVAARLIADLFQVSGLDRVVAVDLHNPAIEGNFVIPLEHLSAFPMLANAVRNDVMENAIVVAPDLGASKLADRYGMHLGLPTAVVHKSRLTGAAVSVRRITGDVRDRSPVVVDDMISTAGTIEAAVEALLEAGCRRPIDVVATHGLLVGPAVQRLSALPIRRLILTDSVAVDTDLPLPIELISLSALLADAIARLHDDRSLQALLSHR